MPLKKITTKAGPGKSRQSMLAKSPAPKGRSRKKMANPGANWSVTPAKAASRACPEQCPEHGNACTGRRTHGPRHGCPKGHFWLT